MKRGCGPCNLCCKLLGVPDIQKPARMLCWHTGLHGGCAVHDQKGTNASLQACAQFKCVWLASQDHDDESVRGRRELRPDLSHVVLGPFDRDDPRLLYIQVDPDHPDAWTKPDVQRYIDEIITKGARVEVIIDEVRIQLPLSMPQEPVSSGIQP